MKKYTQLVFGLFILFREVSETQSNLNPTILHDYPFAGNTNSKIRTPLHQNPKQIQFWYSKDRHLLSGWKQAIRLKKASPRTKNPIILDSAVEVDEEL